MAIPGQLGSAMSAGCHELIRDAHATLVTSVADVIDATGRFGLARPEQARPSRPTDGLEPAAMKVHEALAAKSGKSAQALATESGVPLARVRAVLPALEIDGLAERCESGWRRAA
jgi:DNA processing protein